MDNRDGRVRTRLAIRIHAVLERLFPERRVFLKSDTDTRFIRLRPVTQLAAFAGLSMLVAWSIIATAVLLMDSIGSGNFREQARRDQTTYQQRLNALVGERDTRAKEAIAAQGRFNAALAQISVMQSEVLAAETRRRELETGIEVIQTKLRKAMKERDKARIALETLKSETGAESTRLAAAEATPAEMDFMSAALTDTAAQRDQIAADARDAIDQREKLKHDIRLMQEQNDQIFRQLEEAMQISVEPLKKMFRAAGMPPEQILEQVRRGYSGQGGGPLTPISYSTRGEDPTADELRANKILNQMDKLNLYRIAAQITPFSLPVHSAIRLTSGFGPRRDPVTGGRRMHKGQDFAAPTGTPIYATADGVVERAGWSHGFGKLVVIKHALGIETYYAHNSRILVKKGQRVSRGDHISDMGSTGHSTGPHLHYEIHVHGKAINPMIYIKAARNVF